MATIKLTIDKRRTYSDGRHPLIIRLTSNGKSTSIDINQKALPSEWDSKACKFLKTHPNCKNLNFYLHKRLLEWEKKLLDHSLTGTELPVLKLKEVLLNGNKVQEIPFMDFAHQEIHSLREQERFGNAQSYETAVNRFLRYSGKDITINNINYTLIAGFDTQLIKEGLSRNSVAVYMREIRALLNIAIKKGKMEQSQYPFNSYKIKTQKTVSRAINEVELNRIRNLNLEKGSKLWYHRNVFLLIFNLIGISFIDLALLTIDDVVGKRIVYVRRKTGKIYSIRITNEAKRLLDSFRTEGSKHLLPLGLEGISKNKERIEIALRLSTCNKYLTRIGKLCNLPIRLTTYVARYTWANIAKSIGFPKDQIAEALGHEYGNRITGIYLDNYGSEVIDEMNKRVTGETQ